MRPPAAAAPPPRRRRLRLAVIVAGIVLVTLATALYQLSRPRQLAALVLDRAGKALGLEITASGAADYRLRGTPQLVVRGLDVREPDATAPLLTAERAYLALPWSTLRDRGRDLSVQRIELDGPRLDLAALQSWLATRPPAGPTRIPHLVDGLSVRRGQLAAAGWRVERVSVELPRLHPLQPVAARVGGRYVAGALRAPFDLQLALTAPAADAGMGLAGAAAPASGSWRLPMWLQLGGRLHNGDDGLGLARLRLGTSARATDGTRQLPFTLGVAGAARYREGGFELHMPGLVLRARPGSGDGMVPDADARGRLLWRDALALELDGRVHAWPAGWPTLPAPLGQSREPLPFTLAYAGPLDLSGASRLHLQRGQTRFDGRFRLPAILAWLDQSQYGQPLPPLQGTLWTPRLEIAGATLEGVEISIADDEDDDT